MTETATDVSVEELRLLHFWLQERAGAQVSELAALVGQETPSRDREALVVGLERVQEWMRGHLGDPADDRLIDGGDLGSAWCADWPGTLPGLVVILCHYDTVWPRGTVAARPFCRDGDRITGPGVFDMKAGIVQSTYAVAALEATAIPRPTVRFILTGDEEIGSPVGRGAIETWCPGADVVLVPEPSQDGALKEARKGIGIFTASVHGRAAHAGVDAGEGVHAISAAAALALAAAELADPERGISVNVGRIAGGTQANVVPAYAELELEVRAWTSDDADRVMAALQMLRPPDDRVRVEWAGGWNRPPMEPTAAGRRLAAVAQECAAVLGFDLETTRTSGGSDGNFVSALGIPVLDGLGAVGGGAHAEHEWISASAMPQRATILAAVLAQAGLVATNPQEA